MKLSTNEFNFKIYNKLTYGFKIWRKLTCISKILKKRILYILNRIFCKKISFDR